MQWKLGGVTVGCDLERVNVVRILVVFLCYIHRCHDCCELSAGQHPYIWIVIMFSLHHVGIID